jgi:hypothetical protein
MTVDVMIIILSWLCYTMYYTLILFLWGWSEADVIIHVRFQSILKRQYQKCKLNLLFALPHFKSPQAWCWYLMPVILATWEGKIRPSLQNCSQESTSKLRRAKRTEVVSQSVQCLLAS